MSRLLWNLKVLYHVQQEPAKVSCREPYESGSHRHIVSLRSNLFIVVICNLLQSQTKLSRFTAFSFFVRFLDIFRCFNHIRDVAIDLYECEPWTSHPNETTWIEGV
jgi:hypothetical protein